MLSTPKNISREMELFHLGVAPLPDSYIHFHASAARRDLHNRPEWKILEDHGLVRDGWMDGFRVRRITIAEKVTNSSTAAWVTRTLQWHESGAWFEVFASGGAALYAKMLPESREDWLAP